MKAPRHGYRRITALRQAERERSGTVRTLGAAAAAAGLMILAGALVPWATYESLPGLLALRSVSAVELGPGCLLVAAGLALLVMGVRTDGRGWVSLATARSVYLLGLASLVVLMLAMASLRLGGFDGQYHQLLSRDRSPGGDMLVLAGSLLACFLGTKLGSLARRSWPPPQPVTWDEFEVDGSSEPPRRAREFAWAIALVTALAVALGALAAPAANQFLQP